VHFGIDSHNVEREGEGNSTYGRNLISSLIAGAGRDDDFPLFAAHPDHAFYRTLSPLDRFSVTRVVQGRGLIRVGWSLARAANRAHVEGLHVQYTAPLGYRGPLVVTVHDLSYLRVPESFPVALRIALRALVPWSLRRAARIITASEFSRRDIVAHYRIRSDKVVVTSLAAHPRFRPQTPEEIVSTLGPYGLRPGFLFSLGRLNRRKNLERLLQAYGQIRATCGVEVPLVIGGKLDYGFQEVLRRSKLAGETSGVRVVGLIPDAALPAFYGAATCLVYPSLFEGFGLPVLEAMACGTPVIASSRSALPELVGDAGLLVDPENVEVLSQAMARIMSDPDLRQELGRRGVERSRQYSWAETARRTLAVYREAVQTTESR
jgi:glycosyltransferase involved in cell wall biosynthesis